MKLKSVQVLNYKLCKDVTIYLNDDMNVLLGKNGAGKTTLLQAIHLLSKNSELNLHDITRSVDEKKYDLTTVIASIEDDTTGQIYKYMLKAFFDKDLISEKPKHTSHAFQLDGSKKWTQYNDVEYYFYHLDLQSQPNKKNDDEFKIMKNIINFISKMTYISSTDFLKSGTATPTIQIGKRGLSNKHISRIDRFLIDLHELSVNSPTDYKKYKNLVSRIGSGLVDDIDLIDMELPKSSVKTYRNGVLSTLEESQEFFVPIFTINSNKLYNNQLSEGTFRSLALIFYILNHQSNIIIIEEPELSVHLELLVDIVELMKSTSLHKQVLISTHSERIINMLEYKNINIVKRNEDGIQSQSLLEKLSNGQLESYNNYLSDGGELAELLFSEV